MSTEPNECIKHELIGSIDCSDCGGHSYTGEDLQAAWKESEELAEKIEKASAYWKSHIRSLLEHGNCYLPPVSILDEWDAELKELLK